MSRDLDEGLNQLREDLMSCFRETAASREFKDRTFMATVWLGVIAEKAQVTTSLTERGQLLNEFAKNKSVIEKGIKLVKEIEKRTGGRALAA